MSIIIHPRHETADEFDYQEHFNQFLEEARKNSCKWTSNTAISQSDKYKKNRKSWRNSLFSWLKTDRKGKSTKQPMSGCVSGPVQKAGGGIDTGQAAKAASGPKTGFISPRKKADDEYEVPYMHLGQINTNTQKCCSYGPVYLVT